MAILIDGYGELQFASDDVYRGFWKDGIRHGKVGVYAIGKGSSIIFDCCVILYRGKSFTRMVINSKVSFPVDRLKEKGHSSVSMEWSTVENGSTHRSVGLSLSLSLSLSSFPLTLPYLPTETW